MAVAPEAQGYGSDQWQLMRLMAHMLGTQKKYICSSLPTAQI